MITTFITYIIFFISLISLILFSINTFSFFNINSVYLYKYKINAFLVTITVIIFYNLIFVILVFVLRLYNIGKYLDLKIVFFNITIIWNTVISTLDAIMILLLSLYVITLGFLIVILIKALLNKASLEIYKLYIYITFNPIRRNNIISLGPFWSLRDNDIISYTFHNIIEKIVLKNKNIYTKQDNYFGQNVVNILVNNKKYQLFIQSSPLYFILYDCIFNDFVIIHFYYYMLIYTPIMLFKRITAAITKTNTGFANILWDLYYNNDKKICFIANKEEKEIIDILTKANLGYVDEFLLSMVEFHLKNSITYRCIDEKECLYVNNCWVGNSTYLQIKNKKIFVIIEDDEGNESYKETQEYMFL